MPPLPRLAITMGDPAGVGPEVALRVATDPATLGVCRPIVFGDAGVLRRVAERIGAAPNEPGAWDEATATGPAMLNLSTLGDSDFTPGAVNAATGAASHRYVTAAIDAALAGDVAGVVTGPIHKEAWYAADVPYPGHTELFAERAAAERSCMMLTSREIACSLVTTHVGLRDVADLLSVDRVLDVIELTHQALARMDRPARRITVCGLNPHAGEGGLFGEREEERFLLPAIERAAASGIDVVGPVAADTAFLPATRQATGAYVAMYHDQGLIPLKTLAFDTAVNVTLGLPIVRTSVDHGTALDLAWQGKASPTSLAEAVRLAARLAEPATV